jgi:hypothetical protein
VDVQATSADAFVAESLYDLQSDPQEQTDLAGDISSQSLLRWFRRELDFVMATTPTAQTGWAPNESWQENS